MEPGDSWGSGDGWSKVSALIEVAKKSEMSGWSADRREQFLQKVLIRSEKERERRQVVRAFAAGASAVLLLGLLMRLVGVGSPLSIRPSLELAGKLIGHHPASAE